MVLQTSALGTRYSDTEYRQTPPVKLSQDVFTFFFHCLEYFFYSSFPFLHPRMGECKFPQSALLFGREWEICVFTFFLIGGRANIVVLAVDVIQSCKWKEMDVLGVGFLRQDLKN